MDSSTINTWLGYFGIYMLVGLGVSALVVIYLLPGRIRDYLKERERQQRDRKALASVGIVMKKKKKKQKNRWSVWEGLKDWWWRVPLAWLLWALLLVIFLEEFIRDRLRKRTLYQFSEFECKPEHLRHQTTAALAEAESMITDPLGVVPDEPFGHLNTGWKRFLAQGDAQDELWSFQILPKPHYKPVAIPWERVVDGAEGFAWVRGGKIKAEFFTQWDSTD